MFWTYNSKWDEPSVNNQPRTRSALAVSYDNTKTWQYVMDVDDWVFLRSTHIQAQVIVIKDNHQATFKKTVALQTLPFG